MSTLYDFVGKVGFWVGKMSLEVVFIFDGFSLIKCSYLPSSTADGPVNQHGHCWPILERLIGLEIEIRLEGEVILLHQDGVTTLQIVGRPGELGVVVGGGNVYVGQPEPFSMPVWQQPTLSQDELLASKLLMAL